MLGEFNAFVAGMCFVMLLICFKDKDWKQAILFYVIGVLNAACAIVN